MEIARHAAGVTDITFEDPWVAAGSLDGTISLLNLQHKLHPELHAVRTGVKSTGSSVVCLKGCNKHDGGIERQLQCHSGPVYCLDMSNQWITCGAERPTVSAPGLEPCLKEVSLRFAHGILQKLSLLPRRQKLHELCAEIAKIDLNHSHRCTQSRSTKRKSLVSHQMKNPQPKLIQLLNRSLCRPPVD